MKKMSVFHDHELGYVRIGPEDGSALTLDDALEAVNRLHPRTASRAAKAVAYVFVGLTLATIASGLIWLVVSVWRAILAS